MNKTRQNKDK